jgi:hypothetical protein
MFCHSLYRFLFPRAKYIYLVRDGRDVVLSHGGIFHLTGADKNSPHWEYFKIITFGISNDLEACPFEFPQRVGASREMTRNRYWIQAKSWREHVRMMEELRQRQQLSPNVHMIRYEELCREPIRTLERLFEFLEVELTAEAKANAVQLFHTRSVGIWKDYPNYVRDCEENIEMVFESMRPELDLLGYTD